MAYTRSPTSQMNSWKAMGNDGWDWDSIWPYYLKHEEFEMPETWQILAGLDYELPTHGIDGPVKVGWLNDIIPSSTVFDDFNKSHAAIGVPWNADVNDGSMLGFPWHPNFIDQKANLRVNAGNAYHYPIANRSNLHMYSNTHADKIIFNTTTGDAVAGGVQVTAADGTSSTIYAGKEVIVSAGSLRSPVILELSGVGNPE